MFDTYYIIPYCHPQTSSSPPHPVNLIYQPHSINLTQLAYLVNFTQERKNEVLLLDRLNAEIQIRDPSPRSTAGLHRQGHAHLHSLANSTLLIYNRKEGKKEERIWKGIEMEKGELCVQYSFSHWVLIRLHIRLREDLERDRNRWGRIMCTVLFSHCVLMSLHLRMRKDNCKEIRRESLSWIGLQTSPRRNPIITKLNNKRERARSADHLWI